MTLQDVDLQEKDQGHNLPKLMNAGALYWNNSRKVNGTEQTQK